MTIRKRIVRRIIVLPDGSKEEVEEEEPLEDVPSDHDEVDMVSSYVMPEDSATIVKHLIAVERLHVTRVIRKPDGTEKIIDESDTIFPLEFAPEEECQEEHEDDHHGVDIRRVVRRPVMVTSKRTAIRRTVVLPGGEERELEKTIEEAPKEEGEPRRVQRIVRKFKIGPGGEKSIDEPEYVSPLQCSTTEVSEPEVEIKIIKGKEIRTMSRKSITSSQNIVIRRVLESKDGKSEVPVEDIIEEPVEPSKYTIVKRTIIGSDGKWEVVDEPDFELPEDAKVTVDEEKDSHGVVIRRIVRRPVPVITRRRVYRKVVLAPDGTEKCIEEKVEEPSQAFVPDTTDDYIPGVKGLQPTYESLSTSCDESTVDVVLPKNVLTVFRKADLSSTACSPVERRIYRKILRVPFQNDKLLSEESFLVPLSDDVLNVESLGEDMQKVSIVSQKIITKRILRQPDGEETILDEVIEREGGDEKKQYTEKGFVLRVGKTVEECNVLEESIEVSPLEHSLSLHEYKHSHLVRELNTEDSPEVRIHKEIVTTEKLLNRVIGVNDNSQPIIIDILDEPTECKTPDGSLQPTLVSHENNKEGNITRCVLRRPVPVITKRTVYRTAVVTEDGKETEIEKSQEETPVTENTSGSLVKAFMSSVFTKPEKTDRQSFSEMQPEVATYDEPECVERHVTDRVVQYPDGSEQLIDQYEFINSLEKPMVSSEPEVQRVTDSRGRIVKTVVVRRVYVTVKTIVVRKVIENPDGTETEIESSVEQKPDSESEEEETFPEQSQTHDITSDDAPEVIEEMFYISPLESSFKQYGEKQILGEVTLSDGSVGKTVQHTSEVTSKRLITRKIVEHSDTSTEKEKASIEDLYDDLVEEGQSVDYVGHGMEGTNAYGDALKNQIHKTKPIQTKRIVYKKLILTPEEAELTKLTNAATREKYKDAHSSADNESELISSNIAIDKIDSSHSHMVDRLEEHVEQNMNHATDDENIYPVILEDVEALPEAISPDKIVDMDTIHHRISPVKLEDVEALPDKISPDTIDCLDILHHTISPVMIGDTEALPDAISPDKNVVADTVDHIISPVILRRRGSIT